MNEVTIPQRQECSLLKVERISSLFFGLEYLKFLRKEINRSGKKVLPQDSLLFAATEENA